MSRGSRCIGRVVRCLASPLALFALLWAGPTAASDEPCLLDGQGSQRDFRCWTLEHSITLDGNWQVRPGALPEVVSAAFLTEPDWDLLPVTRALQQLDLPPLGSQLSYQLELELPGADLPIYLRLGESYSNLQVWVVDATGELQLIHHSHEVATDRVLRLPALADTTTLVFHVENTLHPTLGGITRPPELGTQDILESRIRAEVMFGAFSCGALVLLALINWSLWSARKHDTAPLYIALAALVMCARMLDSARLLPLLLPDTPYFLQWQFGWYTMELFILIWVLFVRALAPADVPAWLVSLTGALCFTVIAGSVVNGDAASMIRWGTVSRGYGLFVLMLTGWYLIKLVRERQAVTRSLFASLLIAVSAMAFDVALLALRITTVPSMSNYAFLLFALLQTIDMNRRYLTALAESEALTYRLEERVQERTEELTRANERLAQQATTDGLTGLKNRRAFNEVFSKEIERLKRGGDGLCLALLDIDFFKSINDSHGHDGGDQVLKNVARLLEQELRATDTVARIGGEEFAVLLPTQQVSGARARLEELRQRIANSPLEDEDKQISVTVSIGLTRVTAEDSIKKASKRADDALYAAKRGGRNQLQLASG